MVDSKVTSFAPGRVNLVGEHTDYNGGRALTFAIAAGIRVTAEIKPGGTFEVHAADLDEEDEFRVPGAEPLGGDWRSYVRGIACELFRIGLGPSGARLEIRGSLPRGAGLSSSAALEVATAIALIELGGQERPPVFELAEICSQVEHRWVGVRTGLLDQVACQCGDADSAWRIDFTLAHVERIPLALGGWTVVALDSGEPHTLATSLYNARRDDCAAACRLLDLPSLSAAEESDLLRLPKDLEPKARHVVAENDRVDQAVAALGEGDFERLGGILNHSHASLRDLYDVSTPSVEATVAELLDHGAAGARVIGAGFGGHVLALFPPETPWPRRAEVLRPAAGARVLSSGEAQK